MRTVRLAPAHQLLAGRFGERLRGPGIFPWKTLRPAVCGKHPRIFRNLGQIFFPVHRAGSFLLTPEIISLIISDSVRS